MANLSFNDFIKIFTAYQQYVTAQAPQMATPVAPVAPQMTTPVAPAPQMTTPVAPAPQMTTPVAPVAPYQEQYQALEQRLTAMEQRAPMPTMDTPAPVTVDDIIKGIIS